MDTMLDEEDGNLGPLQAELEVASDEPEEALPPPDEEPPIQQVLTSLNQLRQDFETKLMYDASKERQIDGMHQELQGYREGLHFRLLRPMFHDLIAMYDDLGK